MHRASLEPRRAQEKLAVCAVESAIRLPENETQQDSPKTRFELAPRPLLTARRIQNLLKPAHAMLLGLVEHLSYFKPTQKSLVQLIITPKII